MKNRLFVDFEKRAWTLGLKWLCILYFILPISGWAADWKQDHLVTLNLHECNVHELFKEIRKQTGLRFVYNESYVNQLKNLTVTVNKQSVKKVLDEIFRETSYCCQFENNVIYISPRLDPRLKEKQKEKLVKVEGTVRDNKGGVLPGVTVLIKETKSGVSTDLNGKYTLMLSPAKTFTIIYSFVGMKSRELTWKGQSVVDVVLEEDQKLLEDVVVIGYGVRKAGTLTGSVSTVKAGKMEKMPVASVSQALQGQSAGVQVMSNSGKPGESATIHIRGINSITAATAPLYILDGVVVDGNCAAALNMADIESVSMLKDASSTSIYGARAANGVILMTSKKGRAGGERAAVSFRSQFGWSDIAYGKVKVMNTKERLDYEEMIGYHEEDHFWRREDYETTDINWKRKIFNNHAPVSSYDLSVAGSGQSVSYYVSAGYFSQDGIAPNSSYKRYSFKVNIDGKFTSWLNGGGMLSVGYERNSNILASGSSKVNPALAAWLMLPYNNPYKPDGSLASIEDGSFLGRVPNPLEYYEKAGKRKDNRVKMIGSLFLEVKPFKGLSLKSMLGVDASDSRATTLGYPSYYVNNYSGSFSEGFNRNYALTLTNTATYLFEIDAHHFNILAGQEALQSRYESHTATGIGQTDDRLMTLSTSRQPYAVSGSMTDFAFLSWFSRISYDYRNRYFLDVSVRGDASSRFGKGNRWAHFWAVGGMWKLKDEAFLYDVNAVSDMRLSASIGTSGNSSIGDYDHLALVGGSNFYVKQPTWVSSSPGNEDLSWERLRDLNVTLNVGLWKRLTIEVAWYNRLTSDMLLMVPIPVQRGFSVREENVGKMRNTGFELTLDADLVRADKFGWNLAGNCSYNNNKILELYNGIDSYTVGTSGVILKVGEPASSIQSVRFAGVNPGNGEALWYDKDGKLTNEYNTSDAVILPGKCSIAPWSGSFTNTFHYGNWSLSVFFNWVKDRYMFNNLRYFTESNGNAVEMNQSPKMLECWKQPGDITEVPRYGIIARDDDRFIEDASFLRLKNLMLTYRFPARWLQKTGILRGAMIFAQAQNLWTVTKYKGIDPESPGNLTLGEYPQTRQYTFGFELNF